MTNVGLIGCGGIAQHHLRIYRSTSDVQIVAICDIDINRARATATEFGVDKFFSRYIDLLEMKNLDLVDICTPTSTHASIAIDTAKSGHSILLEKPMATSSKECERIIDETRRQGIKLCVCHNQIYYPSIQRAKSIVESQGHGIVHFRTSVKENPKITGAPKWNFTPEEKGILWEVGYHPAYLQRYFLGEISEVFAYGSRVSSSVVDNFTALLRGSDERYGLIEVSWTSKDNDVTYEIADSDGERILIDRDSDSIKKKEETSLFSDIRRVLRHFQPGGGLWGNRYFVGHQYLFNEYLNRLKQDAPPPVQPEDGMSTVRLLEAIEESLLEHRTVKLTARVQGQNTNSKPPMSISNGSRGMSGTF